MVTPRPEDVVRAHAPQVHRHLKRIFGPGADVEDLLQNVMLEIVRWLPGFEGRAQLSTWIHRITVSVAYQELRRRKRHDAVVLVEDADALPSADVGGTDAHAEVERRERAALLYRALDALAPKKRVAVVLYEIEGMSLREIAELLSIPLQTVASQVRTGREDLADVMRALLLGRSSAGAATSSGASTPGKGRRSP